MPGTVRISTPMRAASGTAFTVLPPSMVPTLRVGPPITACFSTPKENASSLPIAFAAL